MPWFFPHSQFRVPPHQHDEQRIRGFAYIEFSCRAEADAAIELDGKEVRGRKIVVEKSKKTVRPTELQGQSSTRQQEGASEPTIFVKHIHWRCTEKEVMKLFSTCGHVVSVWLHSCASLHLRVYEASNFQIEHLLAASDA